MEKTFYTIAEVIQTTGLGRTKIYEEINSGCLKAKKCGTRTLVTAQSLLEWQDKLPDFGSR